MNIEPTDLNNPRDVRDLTRLLNEYASGDAGGAEALPDSVLENLPLALQSCPTYIGLIARDGDTAVGLLNAFWSISSFKARRLINIHDIAVSPDYQRRGIGRALLREIENMARSMDCCKLTLEVLQGNHNAVALYRIAGFESYNLHPSMGDAQFMQKMLGGGTAPSS